MRKGIYLLCAAALVLNCCNFSTKGKQIDTYAKPKRALLVLDVQKDFTAEGARMPVDRNQVVAMIENINSTISEFQKNVEPVIYIRNVFHKNDIANLFRRFAAVEGSSGIAFDDRLNVLSDQVFDKNQPDAFSNHELERYLISNQVSEITVTGVFADQCVYWTSRGALNRGYKVNYMVDAVAAKSAKDIDNAVKSIKDFGAAIVKARN